MNISSPKISVVITTYNHASYINQAIESVLRQDYPDIELIVVDDGSVDNTRDVCLAYPLTYIYQDNQGLPASRNKGMQKSSGDYLVFLDADDWLERDALKINATYLDEFSHAAFVSGSYKEYHQKEDKFIHWPLTIKDNHYNRLLEGNYIGMHGTVMYRRSVLKSFPFDVNLKACEDYDLYLRITRESPVLHHSEPIAVYRIHSDNMSSNIRLILKSALTVLKKQKPLLKDRIERSCYLKGKKNWVKYYLEQQDKKSLIAEENYIKRIIGKIEFLAIVILKFKVPFHVF